VIIQKLSKAGQAKYIGQTRSACAQGRRRVKTTGILLKCVLEI